MNVASSETCVIDANIIFYIHDITNVPGFSDIIETVYQQVIIHEKVYDELPSTGKKFVDDKIKDRLWVMFDDASLSATQKIEYQLLINDIDKKLVQIDQQRGKLNSLGTGEIYSLAAATVIHAEFVCSNDYSIQNVIDELSLEIYPGGNDEFEPQLLIQHRFVELCALVCEKGILDRSQVFKGFKIALRLTKLENRSEYDKLITEFQTLIPASN
ncbi:hypothetical protein [Planomicrobium okeanokoites]|uniref:hypothetical protein n=1 Tax=Planomicrobium okeanokoites TaxID=244 RepID=UPI0024927683|nr:hypothetical protein [Planomicrobium okeanokoites]